MRWCWRAEVFGEYHITLSNLFSARKDGEKNKSCPVISLFSWLSGLCVLGVAFYVWADTKLYQQALISCSGPKGFIKHYHKTSETQTRSILSTLTIISNSVTWLKISNRLQTLSRAKWHLQHQMIWIGQLMCRCKEISFKYAQPVEYHRIWANFATKQGLPG